MDNTHHTGAVLRNVVILNRLRQGSSRHYASPTMAPRRPDGGRVRTAQERCPSAVERTGRLAPYARRADRPGHGDAPGESGFLLFNTGEGAIQARVAMADLAQSSIDAMYFQWGRDTVGRVLLDRMMAAADRGVRVRLLIDD